MTSLRTRPLMSGTFRFRLGVSALQVVPGGTPQISGQCVNPDGQVYEIGSCGLVDSPQMWAGAYAPCDPPCGAAAPPPPAPPPLPPPPPTQPSPQQTQPTQIPAPTPTTPGYSSESRPTGQYPGAAFVPGYIPQAPMKVTPPSPSAPLALEPCPAKPLKVEEWTKRCAQAVYADSTPTTAPAVVPAAPSGNGVTTGLLVGGGVAALVAGAIALGLFR
jgi:hypothetical protein